MAENLGQTIADTVKAQIKSMGTFNLLVAGKAGVGKSTLINAVFEGNLTETGVGQSVTKQTREITKEGIPLCLIDTRGLELAEYPEIIAELKVYAKTRNSSPDPSRHIHAAWICVSEGVPRGEQAEIDLSEALHSVGISVVVVVTQSFRKDGEKFRSALQSLIPHAANVVRVVAADIEIDEGHVITRRGLETLIEITSQLIPEATEKAFAAVQTVKMEVKEKAAKKSVRIAAGAAVAIAATPIPVVSLVGVLPAIIAMLWDVSRIYGYRADKGFITWILMSSAGAMASDTAIKLGLAAIVQFVPGIGQVVNATVTGAAVGIAVNTFGETYIKAMKKLYLDGAFTKVSTESELQKLIRKEVSAAIESAKEYLTQLHLSGDNIDSRHA